ncbi:cytoplasmic protein [Cryptococcus neoformans]|nr:cytoplasmic protein [Cryptococcus neoformans var. grubii]
MHAVGRPSRHSPPAVVALATSPGVGAGPRRGRLGVRVRLAERGVRLVSEGGRQGTRSPPEGEDSATFRKKRRRIPSSSKRKLPEINTKPTSSPSTPPTKPPTLTRTLQVKAAPATS